MSVGITSAVLCTVSSLKIQHFSFSDCLHSVLQPCQKSTGEDFKSRTDSGFPKENTKKFRRLFSFFSQEKISWMCALGTEEKK